MKFRTYGIVLGLFFALGIVFSFGVEASAHEGNHSDGNGITADQVNPTIEDDVKALLTHIIDYYNQAYGAYPGLGPDDQAARTREVIIYGRQIRIDSEDGGLYKNGDVYSMALNETGTVTNHGGHPNLFGYQFNSGATDSTVARTIQALIDGLDTNPTECEPYGDQDRVACATKVPSDIGPVTVIVGLHHAVDDSAFTPPDCSDFMLETTAKDVYNDQGNDNLLEAYVKGIIRVAQEQRAAAVNAQFAEFTADPANLAKLPELQDLTSATAREFGIGVFQRIYSKVGCFGNGGIPNTKYENIYAFIMAADPSASTVLFNGNNFDLNGATLELVDDQLSGEQNIARLFNQKLGDPVNGASTYVIYHWDDPINPDDNVPNFFEDGKVPGTSCKKSYIEVADINANLSQSPGEELYIFGSGTYPGDDVCASGDGDGDGGGDGDGDSDGDGGACAIAGTSNTSQSALLNLFLIASVLFSVAFLRRRV